MFDRAKVSMLQNLTRFPELLSGRNILIYAAGALILNLLVLLPLIETPYLGDDSWCESTIRGYMELTNTSLGQLWWAIEKDYITAGRWYPFVTYYYPLFYFAGRETYKALIIGLIIINIIQFGALVRSLTKSQTMAIMAMLMPPLFFQLRLYHDPILSYYGLMQIETALILGSLSFFVSYLDTKKRGWLLGSAAFYGLSLLTYEAFYGVLVAYVVLAYHKWNKWISVHIFKTLFPFIGLAVGNILIVLVLRLFSTVRYEGNQLNLDLWTWALTFAKQALGAFPLSYFASFPQTVGTILGKMSVTAWAFIILASVALCRWIWVWFKADFEVNIDLKRLSALGFLGLSLWLTPCIIVAGAVKYQQELRWGLAYLPVYVSYFGIMMVILAGMDLLRRIGIKIPGLRIIIATGSAAIVSIVFTLNYATNLFIINNYRKAELHPRLLIETALKNGLFESVPHGSYLICDLPLRPWDSPAFYQMHSGLCLQVVRAVAWEMDDRLCTLDLGTAFAWLRRGEEPTILDFHHNTQPRPVFAGYTSQYDGRQCPILRFKKNSAITYESPDVFFLTYSAPNKDSGIVVLGRLQKLKADNENVLSAAAQKLSIFYECGENAHLDKMRFCAQLVDLRTLEAGPWITFEPKSVTNFEKRLSGTIFTLESNRLGYGIDPRSVRALMPTDSRTHLGTSTGETSPDLRRLHGAK